MLPGSNFTLLLLAFMIDFLRTSSGSHAPVTKTRIVYISVDEDDVTTRPSADPDFSGVSTTHFTPHECPYDPCVVPEVPCAVISAQTKCYCPGLSGPGEPPKPPQIQQVKRGPSGEPEVHWCAPFSTVKFYNVVTEGGESPEKRLGENSRNVTLRGLKVGTRVCVEAVNDAGISSESESSCARYELDDSDQVALRTGVVVGCAAFLLLLTLASLILWRRKSCKKRGTVDEEGLRNPSYSANETL